MGTTAQKIELMQIATLEDLDAEIARVKARNVLQNQLLKQKMKQLPKEALKYGAVAIIPGLIAAKLTKGSYGLASGLFGWLFRKKDEDKKEAKKSAVKSAKRVGFLTGLSYMFTKLSKKF